MQDKIKKTKTLTGRFAPDSGLHTQTEICVKISSLTAASSRRTFVSTTSFSNFMQFLCVQMLFLISYFQFTFCSLSSVSPSHSPSCSFNSSSVPAFEFVCLSVSECTNQRNVPAKCNRT